MMESHALMLISTLFAILPHRGYFQTQTFKITKNTRRLEVSTKLIVGVSPVSCAGSCLRDSSCEAYGFSERQQQCEVYRISGGKTIKKLVPNPDWNYFEKRGKDCADLYKMGNTKSDVYIIKPSYVNNSVQAYCDMETDGGGWTVFQRRQDGSVDFYRSWNDYKTGFGNVEGEFWLGNDNIHHLSTQDNYELRIDLDDGNGTQIYAAYDPFSITSETTKYKLHVGDYTGNAGDSLTELSNDMSFSTRDKDNDVFGGNCAVQFKGAWWYSDCHGANLNGFYHNGPHDSRADGVNWYLFRGFFYSLRKTTMKFRPVDFK